MTVLYESYHQAELVLPTEAEALRKRTEDNIDHLQNKFRHGVEVGMEAVRRAASTHSGFVEMEVEDRIHLERDISAQLVRWMRQQFEERMLITIDEVSKKAVALLKEKLEGE